MWRSAHGFHMGLLLIPDSTKNNCGKAPKYCLPLRRSPSYPTDSTKKIRQFPKRALINPLAVSTEHTLNHSFLSSSWIDITCKSLCIRTNAVCIFTLDFHVINKLLMWLAHRGIWYFEDIVAHLSILHQLYSPSLHTHTHTLIEIFLSSNSFCPASPPYVLLYSVV